MLNHLFLKHRGTSRRHTFRLPNDGAADKLVLDDPYASMPTGWVVVKLGGPAANGGLTLQLTATDGSVRDIQLKRGAANLIRLPDAVSELILRRCPGSSSDVGGATSSALPRPEEVFLREIRLVEAAWRTVSAGGWRQTVAMLIQISMSLRRRGVRGALAELAARHIPNEVPPYHVWIDLYDRLSSDQLAALTARATASRKQPKISIVVALGDTVGPWTNDAIKSVRNQVYTNWELCVAYDCSQVSSRRTLLQQAAADPRIKLSPCSMNDAANVALALVSGAYMASLNHDDVLAPQSLLVMAEAIEAHPEADLLYSDEDMIDGKDRRWSPSFKPDFNPELLHTQNFVSRLGVYRTQMVRKLGGYRSSFNGSQDYDLALRVTAATHQPIIHVPHVLYHRRIYSNDRILGYTGVGHAAEAALLAVSQQASTPSDCVGAAPGCGLYRRVLYPPPMAWPTVTAIVPTRDHLDVLRVCIDGLLDGTDYPSLDIIIADNESTEIETQAYLNMIPIRGVKVLSCPGRFNYSAINNAAAACARGEVLLLINNDVSVSDPGWLREMVTLMMRPNVGAVGARLLYADGTLQHGGVVLGLGGIAGHLHKGAGCGDPGYLGHLHVVHEVSCCTAACLTVWASIFAEVGGLDALNLPVAFNDVDFCMRLRAAGKRILWTPYATLTHWESKSRGSDRLPDRIGPFEAEITYMKRRWGGQLTSDPFFNCNLSLKHENPTLSFPPRLPPPGNLRNDRPTLPQSHSPPASAIGVGAHAGLSAQ
jgi:GT2 family glycosyltransferase